MKIPFKALRYVVFDCIGIKRDMVKLGMYNLAILSIVWWILADVFSVSGPLLFFFLTIPMIWCSITVGITEGNGTMPDGFVCPHCGAGVFAGKHCTLLMSERYHFTCGTTGVIRGSIGTTDHYGRQCRRNQAIQQDVKEDTI